jgi:hypothetical protein
MGQGANLDFGCVNMLWERTCEPAHCAGVFWRRHGGGMQPVGQHIWAATSRGCGASFTGWPAIVLPPGNVKRALLAEGLEAVPNVSARLTRQFVLKGRLHGQTPMDIRGSSQSSSESRFAPRQQLTGNTPSNTSPTPQRCDPLPSPKVSTYEYTDLSNVLLTRPVSFQRQPIICVVFTIRFTCGCDEQGRRASNGCDGNCTGNNIR